MALNPNNGIFTFNGRGLAASQTIQGWRENFANAALQGASGTVKVILEGGAQLTGTVDTSNLGPNDGSSSARGGWVKITDTSAVQWLVPLSSIVAVGQ